MTVKIYELRDPRDPLCTPRYIGITKNKLEYRLSGHLSECKLVSNIHKNNWIKKLLREGTTPTIHLIEETDSWESACKIEQYWIKEFREQGYKLTNTTDGGDGNVGGHITEETREKIRKAHLGSKRSEEARRNMCKAQKGKTVSLETRLKISNTLRGRKIPPEVVEKIANKHRGIKISMESIEKRRKALMGHIVLPETREKLRKANNKPIIITYPSGETREYESIKECAKITKISDSSLGRFLKGIKSIKYGILVTYKNNDGVTYSPRININIY